MMASRDPVLTIAIEAELALARAGIPGRVRIVLPPAWTTDWMSANGRRKLLAYGIAPPVKGSRRRGASRNRDRRPAPGGRGHHQRRAGWAGRPAAPLRVPARPVADPAHSARRCGAAAVVFHLLGPRRRRVAGGDQAGRGRPVSTWAHGALQPGATLEVMPPQGRFGMALEPGAARIVLGVAAGSGTTPTLSILESVLTREPRGRFILMRRCAPGWNRLIVDYGHA